jgi:anti-sigma regulatory factor (Ser/Thr protein kinase)
MDPIIEEYYRRPNSEAYSLHLSVPPLPRYARSARTALSDFARDHHVASVDIENLAFALGEALANAIEQGKSRRDIDVGLTIDSERVVATVIDKGCGFEDPPRESVPFPPDAAQEGRGFAIMQRCSDFFHVQSAPGQGTVVTMGRIRSERSGTRGHLVKR